MKNLPHISIGATLFIPALHKHLVDVVCNDKYPKLKSVLIDTEDGLQDDDLDLACKSLESLLSIYEKKSLLVYVRPRDTQTLEKILKLKNIEKIEGFILPKFSLQNAESYFEQLKNTSFSFMPSIEGEELFDINKLLELRDKLLNFKEKIPLVRFGLEDMLRQLHMKRSCEKSAFDYAVSSFVLGQFIAIFKGVGFSISGGVYPCFGDDEGFKKDLLRDLEEGLFGKTLIHPKQIELSHALYKVTKKQYAQAIEIIESKLVVFNQESTMAETKTMSTYAQEILKRADVYGLR